MSKTQHIDSFYAQTVEKREPFQRLSKDSRCEVCVVGGGLAGLTCALELAKAGKSVVLSEANSIGWGASGRNGGFVSEGFAEGLDEVIARVGEQHGKKLFEQSALGVSYVRNNIDMWKLDDIIQGQGGLKLIRHGDVEGLKNASDLTNKRFNLNREFWSADKLRQFVNTSTYEAAVYNPAAFHIHPLRYAEALSQQAKKWGADIHENTSAVRLEKLGGEWKVTTERGSVAAQHMVLCTSAYGGIFPLLERALVAVATYVVASKPLGSRLDGVIDFQGTLADTRRAGDYFRTVGKGEARRLIWGGRITTKRNQPKQLARLLKKDIGKIFPQISDLEIESAWSGLMGYTRHKMPLIGEPWREKYPDLWVCTGFGGHGLNTTAMGGKLVANAISSGDEAYRLFAPYQPVWTGGAIGRAATQLAYWQMQWRDARDEKQL